MSSAEGIYVRKNTRALYHLLLISLISGIMLYPLREGSAQSVTLSITFGDGTRRECDVDAGTSLQLKTNAGKVMIPISNVVSVDLPIDSELVDVTLQCGDLWRLADDEIVSRLGLGETVEDRDQHRGIRRVDQRPSPSKPPPCPHYLQLLLEDGSQVRVEPNGLTLPVSTENGKWDLPIGSLRTLKLTTSGSTDHPDTVLARFLTGHVERFSLHSFLHYLKATDGHGNSLKVYHRDVRGILHSTEPSISRLSLATETTSPSKVTMSSGETEWISVPFCVWELRTDVGDLLFPSPLVSSLSRVPDDSSAFEITTVYGDLFTGRLVDRKLRVSADTDPGHTDISMRDVASISGGAKPQSGPLGRMVFWVKGGIALTGCFAGEQTGLESESGEKVPSSIVHSLNPVGNGTFVLVSRGGKVRTCTAVMKKASIVALVNGASLSVPWSDVLMVTANGAVDRQAYRARLKTENDNEGQQDNRTDPGASRLRVPTEIGALWLPREQVSVVSVDRTSSKAYVMTAPGDLFVTSVPSVRWFRDLKGDKEWEFPDRDQFRFKWPTPSREVVRRNAVVCRLVSGDILVGRLPEQELTLRRQEDRQVILTVPAAELNGLFQNGEGGFVAQVQSKGAITCKIEERSLQFALISTGETNAIPVKEIEALAPASSALPPMTVYRPGIPQEVTGEALIKGGRFQQGSNSGMPDEKPVHTVSLGAFFMDATEVTRAQFACFVEDAGHTTGAEETGGEISWRSPGFLQQHDDPVVFVSWTDAAAYCNWRSKQAGLTPCYRFESGEVIETDRLANGYRLPTEAEWEFAARGRGEDRVYPWGNHAPTVAPLANYRGSNGTGGDHWEWTNPVKALPETSMGLFGLAGNVWEWCEDWYFDRAYTVLQGRESLNPCITHENSPTLTRRSMRGGSYRNPIELLQCTSRGNGHPHASASHVGFRCVRSAE